MNRLVIIGNGFDMAHGLKTSYMDFINWYWERRLNAMLTEHASISEDCLCKLEIKNTKDCASWSNFFFFHSFRIFRPRPADNDGATYLLKLPPIL